MFLLLSYYREVVLTRSQISGRDNAIGETALCVGINKGRLYLLRDSRTTAAHSSESLNADTVKWSLDIESTNLSRFWYDHWTWHRLGFGCICIDVGDPKGIYKVNVSVLKVPLLVPIAMAFALGGGLWQYGARQRKRQLREEIRLCLRCGYDCRASSGRCPECGSSLSDV